MHTTQGDRLNKLKTRQDKTRQLYLTKVAQSAGHPKVTDKFISQEFQQQQQQQQQTLFVPIHHTIILKNIYIYTSMKI